MRSIAVNLPHASYEIRVGAGLLQSLKEHLAGSNLNGPFLIVTQPRIRKALGRDLKTDFEIATIPDGERAKTFSTVSRLVEVMMKAKVTRQSTIIAFGGGVVGDVAGFVASIYMRGIAIVQVPTTLLAQVDSSIGGKTAVNYKVAKNLVGTYYQPRLVLCDPNTLRTLPEREYRSGLYEVLKYGIIQDPELFRRFENGIGPILEREVNAVEELVATCAAIKARVVMADEKETDLRRILNFGHTIGHALESSAEFHRVKHGEAVGYGMIAASRISAALGLLEDSQRTRIEHAVRAVGRLPYLNGVRSATVLEAIGHDKKIQNGVIHFVLPRAIGRTEITSQVPLPLIRDVVKGLLDESRRTR